MMASKRALKAKHIPLPSSGVPSTGKGRLLSVEDVQRILPRKKGGKSMFSKLWIKRTVAPEKVLLIGGMRCWWERDLLEWIEGQTYQLNYRRHGVRVALRTGGKIVAFRRNKA